MARLNPNHIPDRFALDRYARQMRSDEMARVVRAIADAAGTLIRRATDALGNTPKPRVLPLVRAQRA